MKIKNLTIKKSNVNLAENLNIYQQITSLNDFAQLIKQLQPQQVEVLNQIKHDIDNQIDNKTIMSEINDFIQNHLLPIGYSISGSMLFEMIRSI